jgi:hypothetical protein
MGQSRLGSRHKPFWQVETKRDTIFSDSDLIYRKVSNSGIRKEDFESPVVGIRNLAP